MELITGNIQVLLKAAEFLERREREAEHGYASLAAYSGESTTQSQKRLKPQKALKNVSEWRGVAKDVGKKGRSSSSCKGSWEPPLLSRKAQPRSMHNELEKHRMTAMFSPSSRRLGVDLSPTRLNCPRRAQLRQCLEQLKQQVPLNSERSRSTTLSLLHHARLHIKKLEEQEQKAQRLKERLRCKQQILHQRLQLLIGHSSTERLRVDSLDSSQLSSDRSDSDQEVDVEGLEFSRIEDAMVASFSTGQEHSYSNTNNVWL